jgi:glycosyltransferase involved in cell wall biosynthesis
VTVLAPAYWPTIGGGQMVAREFAHRVRGPFRVSVLRLHGEAVPGPVTEWSLCAGVASGTSTDDGVPVVSVGSSGATRRVLAALASVCPRARPARLVYELCLFHGLRGRLARQLRETRLLHLYGNGLPSAILVAHRVARRRRIPLVVTPFWHINGPSGPAPRLSPRAIVLPRVCRTADAVIAMTGLERESLIDRGVPPQRCHVIPAGPVVGGGADPQGFRRRHRLGSAPLVLFLGRQWSVKGYRSLADAAPLVWAQRPEARFLFVGPESEESIEFFRPGRDAHGRLVSLGTVSLEDKTSALAACDVLCVPSSSESLGLVYLEAWAMKKPVIAERIPVLETIVGDGVDGILVDRHPASIARAICRLLADPPLARAMGEAGAAKVERQYRWSSAADRLSQLYADLLQRNGR